MCFYPPLFFFNKEFVCFFMAFVLRQWRRPTSGRKVLHLYWLQAPILDASPPQALVEQSSLE